MTGTTNGNGYDSQILGRGRVEIVYYYRAYTYPQPSPSSFNFFHNARRPHRSAVLLLALFGHRLFFIDISSALQSSDKSYPPSFSLFSFFRISNSVHVRDATRPALSYMVLYIYINQSLKPYSQTCFTAHTTMDVILGPKKP